MRPIPNRHTRHTQNTRNKLTTLLLAGAASLCFSQQTAARDLEVSLGNDTASAQINFLDNNREIALAAGYTYHEGERHIINLDFHAQGRVAMLNLPTTAGVGIQAIGFDDGNLEGAAVGLGGFLKVNIPRVPGLSVSAEAHFAPAVVSFDDAEDLTSLGAKVGYRLIRNAEIFAGYRYLKADVDNRSDLKLDKGGLVGLRILF